MMPSAATPPAHGYRADIDGLRAIAVLSVVLYHLSERLPHGYLGVDVFFVISGYVVTRSLLAQAEGPAPLRAFYLRRFKRLFPALAVMLVVTGALALLVIPPAELGAMVRTAASATVGLSNWTLLAQETDYFGVGAELDLFTHTWSLAVEEQFYVLLAPLVLTLTRWRLPVLVVLGGASMALAFGVDPAQAFYGTHARFYQLLAGVLVALAPTPPERVLRCAAALGLGLVVIALISGIGDARSGSLAATFGAALLVLPAPRAADPFRRFLAGRVLTAVGRRSYSLYLWHWPVIVLARWTIGATGPLVESCSRCSPSASPG